MNNPLVNKLLMILIGLIALGVIISLSFYLINLLMPFLIGLLIAMIANPLVKTFRKMKFPRILASFLSVLFVLGSVIGLFYFLFHITRNQFATISETLKYFVKSMMQISRDTYTELANRFPSIIQISYDQFLHQNMPNFSKALTDNSLLLGGRLFSFAKSLPSMGFFLIISFISSFYISIEYDRLRQWFQHRLEHHPRIHRFISRLKGSASLGLGSWLRAQGIVMSVLAVIASLGFRFIGYRHSILMGIMLALFDALPIFGSGAILLPLTLYNILFGRFRRGLFHLMLYLMITITRQLIEPRILGKQIGINPLLTLFTIYLGFRLAGFIGILFGVILMVVFISIYNNKSKIESVLKDDLHYPPETTESD